MIVSLHPIVDQLAQYLDGQVCNKKKSCLNIPLNLRLYLVVRLLRRQLKLKRRKDLDARIDYFDPENEWFSAEQNAKLGIVRHLLLQEEEWGRFDAANTKYITAVSKLHPRSIEQSLTDVGDLFRLILVGHLKIVEWDEFGRMELEISPQGARYSGRKAGDRFFANWTAS